MPIKKKTEIRRRTVNFLLVVEFQLWSSKWSIKDEHKLLSELGGTTGSTGHQSGYYDAHGGFPGVGTTNSAADLYDTINTMSQATSQNLYTPSLGENFFSKFRTLCEKKQLYTVWFVDCITVNYCGLNK